MILWRVCEGHEGLKEGMCISEGKYKEVFYLNKYLYEPIQEHDLKTMIEVKDKNICDKFGLEGLWFWDNEEAEKFKLWRSKLFAG